MSTLTDIDIDALWSDSIEYCHAFMLNNLTHTVCGIPTCEIHYHDGGEFVPKGKKAPRVCRVCGKTVCPDCIYIFENR